MLVFLDLDGVLVRAGKQFPHLEPQLLERFERYICGLENQTHGFVDVVITSAWKHLMPLDEIRQRMGKLLGARVIGATPNLGGEAEHRRYREILAYLRSRGRASENWVAIDDQPEHFPPAAHPHLLLCHPAHGFGFATVGGP